MPSAREFCREPNYPVAIFLTYTFDPLFFERVSLADLKVGGSRRILIAADARQVVEAMKHAVGQIAYLGRRYALAEIAKVGTFHPKLIARLSGAAGRVWLGSGNLTFTGWGGNRELATSWSIGPGEEDDGSWLNQALSAVSEVTGSTTFADQLREIRREIPWLTSQSAAPPRQLVLMGLPSRPLASQLADRWRGRRFSELRLCTGSTDVDGAFLGWAHRAFGIKSAILYLSPAYASFDPARLAKLPLDVRIIAAPPEKRLHAKFYWFSGPDGDAAIVGSANCSAAAWLAGNVELVVVYDDAKASDFDTVLTVFGGTKLLPSIALPSKPILPDASRQNAGTHRLVSMRLRPGPLIEALIEPELSDDARASIVIDSKSRPLTIKVTVEAGTLVGVLPADFQAGPMTLFGHAEGVSAGMPFKTEPRWIDNDAMLEQVARPPTGDKSLENLSRSSLAGMDHQRILEAIQSVSARLLNLRQPEPSSLPQQTRAAASSSVPVPVEPRTAPPVDPAALIRSINDLRRGSSATLGRHLTGYGGGLRGVISMLFHQDEAQEIDLTRETWSAAEPEKFHLETQSPPAPASPPPPPIPHSDTSIDRESRAAFRREIGQYLHELTDRRFAEKCDPPRLVEALAFPLLVCIRGREGGWLRPTDLALIATRVANIMFRGSYERGKTNGLIAFVRDRYERLGQQEDFQSVVGDGTLWIALLGALRFDSITDTRTVLPQASAISDVFQSRDLLTNSDVARLSNLISKLVIQNAESQITENADKIAAAHSRLITALSDHWTSLDVAQGSGRQLRLANTLLWSPQWGWYVTPPVPANSYHPGYVDFEAAAAQRPGIAEPLRILLESCGRPGSRDERPET